MTTKLTTKFAIYIFVFFSTIKFIINIIKQKESIIISIILYNVKYLFLATFHVKSSIAINIILKGKAIAKKTFECYDFKNPITTNIIYKKYKIKCKNKYL